jgi:hypothetical protein
MDRDQRTPGNPAGACVELSAPFRWGRMMRRTSRAVIVAMFLGIPGGALAQQRGEMLGPNECLNCHDHQPERQWYEKKEIPEVRRLFPDKDSKAGHINSLNQLEGSKSDEFARAIGLSDKYDPSGKCVACHATVYRGEPNAGVSCESCHGAGSLYLKPHQTKGSYDVAVAQYGMTRLIGNIQGWTQQCTNCHIMDDDRLVKAGHPSGDDFDLSKKYVPVSLHFKKQYSEAEVAAIAGPQRRAILALRRSGFVDEPPAAAAPVVEAPAVVAATATPVAPTPSTEAPVVSAPGSGAPAPARVAAAPAPAKRRAAPRVRSTWSPTSIEPRVVEQTPPVAETAAAPESTPLAAPPSATSAPARAVEPLPRSEEPIQTRTLVFGGLAIALMAAVFWSLGRRSRQ